MTASSQHKAPSPIWLFDEMCVLCAGSVAFTLHHEQAPEIRFVAITSTEGRVIAASHGINPENPDTFLFIDAGRALPKSGGVIALCRYLRWPWRAGVALVLVPRPIRDWVYDRVARNRYAWFGKRETCLVPDQATRARFVLPDAPIV
jgi:predicted DCC family thiol-disulfide oxidoreductase YuxK